MVSTPSAIPTSTTEPTTLAPRPALRANQPPSNPEVFLNMNIVLNIYRSQDPCIREVISLRDIIEEGRLPSWDKVVEILSVKVGGVRVFDPQKDMMLFEGHICVQNRRQFLAALQWMCNKETSGNINVPIHGSDKESREKAWGKK